MANTLMFSVGIELADKTIQEVKDKLSKGVVSMNDMLNLKVKVDNIDVVVRQLNQLGNNESLQNLRKEITMLNEQFAQFAKGAGGVGSINIRGIEQEIEKQNQKVERYKNSIAELTEEMNRMRGGRFNPDYQPKVEEVEKYKLRIEGVRSTIKELEAQLEQAKNAGSSAASGLKVVDTASAETKANTEALTKAISELGSKLSTQNINVTGIENLTTQVQNLVTQIKVLVEQYEKLNKVEQNNTTNGGIFEPQKFTSLQDAIDKIIKEMVRLKEAFESLGKTDSFTSLKTTIESLGTLLGNFAERIKLEPVDEQIRILTERCEKAEKKLMEVGEAAKYLNKQAGERTQQKATTIAGIAGLEDGSEEKVTNVSERFLKLLVEIENQMAKIGKIQLFGEQSGFSPVILKQAVEKFDALKSMVNATIKGEPIINGIAIPQTNDQLSQFIAQFALLKSSYKDIIAEADRFNKTNEKDSLKQKNEELRAAAANIKAAENESRKLTETISNLEALANKAGALGVDTTKIRSVIDSLKGYRDVMNDITQNNSKNTKATTISENFLNLKRTVKEVAQEIKKDMAAALKPNNEQANAFKEYATLMRRITSLTKTAFSAEKFGLDSTQLNQYINKLTQYAQALEQITRNGGVGFTLWKQSDTGVDYQNVRTKADAEQASMNAKIAEEKAKNAAATNQLTAEEQKLADAMNRTSGEANKQSQVLSDLKSMAMQYLSVYGVQSFLSNIIEIGGQLEMQRLSIGAILGDMDKANTLFEQLKAKAIKSPFGIVELDQMTKQLTAYGFQYGELYDMTMRLADISAATGTGVDRLALALGHVRSEAALSGYTLRQFSMANIPLLQKLSENLGKTTKEIRAMVRKKEVSYKDVIDVIKELTDEGGMFYNAQEVMSESVKAKWKNLRDAFAIMYGEMAEGTFGDVLKEIAGLLTKAAKDWEKLATAVLASATAFGAARVYMSSFNRILGSNTASVLQNIRATLQQENAYLRLYRAAGIITKEEYKTLSVREKYTASSIKVALVTNKLTVEELRRAVILGKVKKEVAEAAVVQAGYDAQIIKGVTVLSWWRKGLFLAGEGFMKLITSIRAGIVSLAASIAPMLALTAVFEAVYHSIQQNNDAEEAGKEAADKMKTKYDELVKVNKELGSSEGKTNKELKEGVDQMQKALDKAGLLTPELKEQVAATDDLAGKFNILREALQGAATDFDDLKSRLAAGLIEALSVGGGSSWNPVNWFRDNMNKDIQEYQESRNKFNNMINSEAARKNIEKYMRDNNLWKGGYAGMSGLELFGMLSDDQKSDWAHMSGSLLRQFGGQIDKTRDAYLEYVSDSLEISGSQGKKFAEAFRDNVLNQVLNVNWSNLSDDDMINIDREIRRGLNGIPNADSATKEELRKIIVDNLIGKEIPEYVKEVLEEEFVEDYGGDEGEEDVNAKLLREKVRILKEAADSYKYWRDKVGEGGAIEHVNEEYGQLLGEQGFTVENVENLRESLLKLREEYEKKPKSKDMLQAIKEIDKEIADLNRNDYEKSSETILSRTQKQLDDLTRSWEIFNSVRDATGNTSLAEQVSGASYQSGQMRNLADALREKIQRDFYNLGSKGIGFNTNLSDKEIDESIKAVLPKASQESIAAMVEQYKKWRDLQRDVLKNDIDVFAKLVGSVKDYESQIRKINDNLSKQLESIDKLESEGKISSSDADAARKIAAVQALDEKWKISLQYTQLMNNSLVMSREEVENGINRAVDILNQKMEANLITAQEYADEMEKITKIGTDWKANSFFGGKGRFAAYANGGLDGLISYQQSRINRANADNNPEELEDATNEYDKLNSLKNVFDDFKKLEGVLEPVVNLFNDLGMSALGDILGVGSKALSSATSMGSGAAALFGASAGPWGAAIGAGVSIVGSIFALHDKSLQKQIDAINDEVKALEANTKAIQSFRERTLGYDNGDVMRRMASQYRDILSKNDRLSELLGVDFYLPSEAKKAMKDFYGSGKGSGYSQELANLKKQREDYIKMYDLESDKKDASTDALNEYRSKIIELDEQIAYFAEDLTKEMFGIDFKGWSDQISDALMTAFENGEDAAEAFNNTVSDIMRQTLRNMLSIGVIQPMMEKLRKKLFGENGNGGSFNALNPEGTIDAAMQDVANFFGEGGEGQKMIDSAQLFYDRWDDFMESRGISLKDEGSSSGLSKSIQGLSEQKGDLLASYLNSTRAYTAQIQELSAEYYPQYLAAMTRGNESLRNIEDHTDAIMRSNDEIQRSNEQIYSLFAGLRNSTWRMPVA